ncbi:uncharacterized protein LOC116200089 [Punica granatum]|uniref:Uncharacterized protein LOC116200089 n=2 Tax=Punica granatum TaxID=22663 RepID=A0A6P8CQB1_PUNGR|nr:uncharacterized protein LOC116200089 [Punica granatum]PKI49832.1 hypothetical protein CRG98_029776 [Punica granatum]
MDPSSKTETGTNNAAGGGQVNIVIDAVDHRSSARQGQQLRDVQVVHQPHNTPSTAKTSGGVLAAAAASAASSLRSAKDAISGK